MDKQSIETMYVDELRALAKDCGVPGAASMRKAELVAALEGVRGGAEPDRQEILYRRFSPGSGPVADGRPAEYRPEPDPQDGESEPQEKPAEKVGEPIGPHKAPREKIREMEDAIRDELTDQELSALSVLAENGWTLLTNPRIENAASRSSTRSYKAKGRYRIGCVKNRIMR